jgi:hypothetical protein
LYVKARTLAAEERVNYTATSYNNRRGVASGVFCGSAPRLYDSTDGVKRLQNYLVWWLVRISPP